MQYILQEVDSPKLEQEFLDVVKLIYRDYPNYVRPFDSSIKQIFDPKKNKLFSDGEAIRWVVKESDSCRVVGRIAAFYNREQASLEEQPTGGCGFFEAIDNKEVAFLLFDAAREWLKSKGMEAMDGPINFGARDAFWGLLVENFDSQPLFENPYNPPYYKALFEEYGFMNYFNQHSYVKKIEVGALSEAVYERVKRLRENPSFRFEHAKRNNLDKLIEDFRVVYNKAWSGFSGVKEMTREEALSMMNMLKPIFDERLLYFAYYDNEPVGFFIMIPDLNRIIGDFDGKLGFWQMIKLWWRLKVRRKVDRVFGLIFGVTPEFQGKGVESGMIYAFEEQVKGLSYKSLELAWIGDFNPVMMRMVESFVCASKFKMHTTYRYLFDREKEFKRCPSLRRKRKPMPQRESSEAENKEN